MRQCLTKDEIWLLMENSSNAEEFEDNKENEMVEDPFTGLSKVKLKALGEIAMYLIISKV